ncbi:hypothetical protein KFK09_020757 [Dendrobium nobile]|uniref:Uncharacterized protein n=1 Tax=Dendrobium nobile TaxID=94219 RepID=A0A8T3ALS7_DENNO|nr:hypothetical protein KFK09_020757 [Dendrobium nobile]
MYRKSCIYRNGRSCKDGEVHLQMENEYMIIPVPPISCSHKVLTYQMTAVTIPVPPKLCYHKVLSYQFNIARMQKKKKKIKFAIQIKFIFFFLFIIYARHLLALCKSICDLSAELDDV